MFDGATEIVANNATQGVSAVRMCSYYEVDKGHLESKLRAENVGNWRSINTVSILYARATRHLHIELVAQETVIHEELQRQRG